MIGRLQLDSDELQTVLSALMTARVTLGRVSWDAEEPIARIDAVLAKIKASIEGVD